MMRPQFPWKSNLLAGWPGKAQVTCDAGVHFFALDRERLMTGVDGLRLPGAAGRWLALERTRQWWCRPRFGKDLADLAPRAADGADVHQVQCLLWQRDGGFAAALPLIDGDVRAYLTGAPPGGSGLSLVARGPLPDAWPESARVLAVAADEDPYTLIDRIMSAAARQLRTFELRAGKQAPPFLDDLGWCTWDSFRTEVDQKKMLRELRRLRRAGIAPSWVLLDDGWQQSDSVKRMISFDAEAKKFPRGIAGLSAALRRQDVRRVGVWVTLQGYWNGVAPDSPLAQRYRLCQAPANLADRRDTDPRHRGHFVDPADAARFFHDWFGHLAAQDVDMVKIDNQSTMDQFTQGVRGHGQVMEPYQRGLQEAASHHLGNQTLHCMCHSSDVVLRLGTAAAMRSSPDFYAKDASTHQAHVVINALNAWWMSRVAWLDWDLLQSGLAGAAFQAAARALSGGPIYLSDPPGRHDPALVKRLTISGGRVLRFPEPGQPTRDCLLTDCGREMRLLKIFNRQGALAVLGLFHCRWSENPADRIAITDHFAPADVPGLGGAKFVVRLFRSGRLFTTAARKPVAVTVPFHDFELATICPLRAVAGHQVGVLGLLDKFAGAAAVRRWEVDEAAGVAWCEVPDRGRIGFYCSAPPRVVRCGRRPVAFTFDRASGLLTVRPRVGGMKTLELRWSTGRAARRKFVKNKQSKHRF